SLFITDPTRGPTCRSRSVSAEGRGTKHATSWPGLFRPSMPFLLRCREDVEASMKPGMRIGHSRSHVIAGLVIIVCGRRASPTPAAIHVFLRSQILKRRDTRARNHHCRKPVFCYRIENFSLKK